MSHRAAKRLRGALKEIAQTRARIPAVTQYWQNKVTGSWVIPSDHPRAVYQRAKRTLAHG